MSAGCRDVGVSGCRFSAGLFEGLKKDNFKSVSKKCFFQKIITFLVNICLWNINLIPYLQRVSKLSNRGSKKPVSAIVQEI